MSNEVAIKNLSKGDRILFPRTVGVHVVDNVFTERGITSLTYRPEGEDNPQYRQWIHRPALTYVTKVD